MSTGKDQSDKPQPTIPEEDRRRAGHASPGSATGGGGKATPVERTPAENPKEHGDPSVPTSRPSAGAEGAASGLQPGGVRPATDKHGGLGEIGQGGGSTGPRKG